MTLPSIDKIREMDKILKKRREDLKTSDPERYKLLAEIDQKMLENLETAASQND
jgi:PHP family Zn ribbon phosphoesterase